MKISDEKNEIAKALNSLQKQLRPASKDSTNPHFKSKYSSYESTWDALRDPLTENSLSCEQDITTSEKSVSVTTLVLHISGQWMEFGPLTMPVTKLDCQGFGSAISYAKRYALQAAFGIVSGEDDDGNAACKKPNEESLPEHKIGPNQAQQIRSLLILCPKGYEPWLLDVMKAKSVEEIALSKFESCIRTINSFLQEQKIKQAPQEKPENG